MAVGAFHHFGVPVEATQENETYIEGAKVYVTDAETHPFQVEYLRFEAGSPMHPDVQSKPHAAFMVDSLEETLKGQNVIIEPFDATESLRVAFINDNGAVIELMEQK
jgi:hypothetical protein